MNIIKLLILEAGPLAQELHAVAHRIMIQEEIRVGQAVPAVVEDVVVKRGIVK